MFCASAEVSKPDDHDAVRRGGAGNGIVAFEGNQFGNGSLLLSDTGRHKFRAIELWNLSAVMPSGDVRFCDQVRPGDDWLWNDRKYVLSGIYF